MAKKEYMHIIVTGALLLGFAGAVAMPACAYAANNQSEILQVKPEKPQVTEMSGIVYKQVKDMGQNIALTLNLLQPHPLTDRAYPLVVYVPGGAFVRADQEQNLQIRMALAERGYMVASLTYRTAPNFKFPAPLEDVKAAIRYLRAHANDYHINPDKIAIMGVSAGGYLSAMTAATNNEREFDTGDNLDVSSQVACGVDLFGPTDLLGCGVVPDGLFVDKDNNAAANPTNHLTSGEAPLLLMHGTKDTLIGEEETEALYNTYLKAGLPAERVIVPEAAHGGVYWVQDEVIDRIAKFLDKYL